MLLLLLLLSTATRHSTNPQGEGVKEYIWLDDWNGAPQCNNVNVPEYHGISIRSTYRGSASPRQPDRQGNSISRSGLSNCKHCSTFSALICLWCSYVLSTRYSRKTLPLLRRSQQSPKNPHVQKNTCKMICRRKETDEDEEHLKIRWEDLDHLRWLPLFNKRQRHPNWICRTTPSLRSGQDVHPQLPTMPSEYSPTVMSRSSRQFVHRQDCDE
jgi:hypothetical protein